MVLYRRHVRNDATNVAASGKGTIAKQVAAVYGLHHLDTRLLYWAVAKAVINAGYTPEVWLARVVLCPTP